MEEVETDIAMGIQTCLAAEPATGIYITSEMTDIITVPAGTAVLLRL